MKVIAKKGVNLNPRTKPKKDDRYKETSDIKKEYKYKLKDIVIFLGLVDEYKGLECSITKRSRRKNTDYYHVIFNDDTELKDIPVGFLKTPEDYKQYILDQENSDSENNHSISDIERKILDSGLTPMSNEKSCMNQIRLYHRDCTSCCYEPTCIYHKKYQYDKINFN